MNKVLLAANEIAPSVIADRRAIHQEPELAYREQKTAALVARRLRELGLEVRTGVAETGVIGVLRGAQAGKTVLLRADMDALPIQEDSDLPYASRHPGVMHACGHDAHTAILLGVARLLAGRRDQQRGSVKFMFQPAEEGGAGAKRMIDEGLMESPVVDAAFALHVAADREVGKVALRAGPATAASDRFTIVVRGKGGHAARPQSTVDPIVVAAYIVTALQTLVSREVSPAQQAVVTVGSLTAGTAANIIPDTATIDGTVRTYNADVQAHMQVRIGELSRGLASGMRATAEVDYRVGYPSLVNDPEMVTLVRDAVAETLGPDAAGEREPVMGGEDFSYVLERVPGAMFFLGIRDPSWKTAGSLHTASFALSEDALPIGVAALTATALRYLNSA